MNRQETAQVLTKIQLGDNRQVDRLVLEYWVESIGELDYEDAQAAVLMHRRERPGVWLEPGHVVAGARRAREAREREERKRRPALEPAQITLDREEFERQTQQAIAERKAARS